MSLSKSRFALISAAAVAVAGLSVACSSESSGPRNGVGNGATGPTGAAGASNTGGLNGGGGQISGAGAATVGGQVSGAGTPGAGGVASGGVGNGTAGSAGGPIVLGPGNRCELAGVTVAKGTTLLVDDVEDAGCQASAAARR